MGPDELGVFVSELPEHVTRNRAYWDDLARQYIEAGERAWAKQEPEWGIWHVPEPQIQIFSEQLAGNTDSIFRSSMALLKQSLCVRPLEVTETNGLTIQASSFIWPMATGYGCYGVRVSRLRI
jgi:hypothetical protein